MGAGWVALPAVGSSFAASLVEVVEAFTIILAVATLRGWRPALYGTGAALASLAGLVVVLGPLLGRIPLTYLRFAIGVLLLLFGMGWLRKAILRHGGVLPLHDEQAIYAAQSAQLTRHAGPAPATLDWLAATTAFKAVLLEGVEVVFIVIAVGAGSGRNLWSAGLGALAACATVLAIGALVRRPLTSVPENALKFGVGVMLSAFGVFWTGEGLGIAWPGGDLALIGFAAGFFVVGFATASVLRRRTAFMVP